MASNEEDRCDGYITKIGLGDKIYKLRCEVVEVYSMDCPKCGSPLELKYGSGKCIYCGSSFTTKFKMEEVK